MRVGIDLGTTNTVVSYIDENGSWKLLEFSRCGSTEDIHFLPSCIADDNGIIVVGQKALDIGGEKPANLLKDAKTDMELSGKVSISGDHKKEKKYTFMGKDYTPQDVAECVLKEVKNELKKQFPEESTFNAFVTVPAKFGQNARAKTKEALRSAGFEMDENCLTDEPVAAAIAYSTRLENDKLVLVVDIGGGTFDLSLLKTSIVLAACGNSRLIPVSWSGDPHLGGNDFDDLLVKKMAELFLRDGGADLYFQSGSKGLTGSSSAETKAAAVLRAQTLSLKKQLYAKGSARGSVFVDKLLDGKDLNYTITVSEYEECMAELASRMSKSIDDLFGKSGYSSGDVDHVLVVGGMAHEICLGKMLKSLFGENRIIIPEDSMYLVSRGAAISNSNLRVHVENKAYTSIGLLKNSGRAVDVIIKEGSTVENGKIFSADILPAQDNATAIVIKLVEFTGEFSPENSTVIFNETIQLVENPNIGNPFLMLRAIRRGRKKKLSLNIEFTEDKILKITVKQRDGSIIDLGLRLGR